MCGSMEKSSEPTTPSSRRITAINFNVYWYPHVTTGVCVLLEHYSLGMELSITLIAGAE